MRLAVTLTLCFLKKQHTRTSTSKLWFQLKPSQSPSNSINQKVFVVKFRIWHGQRLSGDIGGPEARSPFNSNERSHLFWCWKWLLVCQKRKIKSTKKILFLQFCYFSLTCNLSNFAGFDAFMSLYCCAYVRDFRWSLRVFWGVYTFFNVA